MNSLNKTIGIIGGMGPLATVKLFEKIVLLTNAETDQEHLHILVDNNTSIPDRTDFILGKTSTNPIEQLILSAKKLESMGADFLIMPCNTAHYFFNDLVKAVTIPVVNMIEETAKYICETYENINTVGLLSTEATANKQLYENIFNNYGLNIIKPSIESQNNITELIYSIKSGIEYKYISKVYSVMKEIENKGTDLFILGCTELPIAVDLYKIEGTFIDTLEILALKSIEYAKVNIHI